MLVHLNKENFVKEVNNSSVPVLIDFWASWCGPCQMMAPVFEEASKDYEGKVKFAKLSTEEESSLAAAYGIQGIPCMVLLSKNKEIGRIVGFMLKPVLKAKLDEIIKKNPEAFRK
ncbi:MAG: thioredoxin [Candidatus Woesearchaeota archaeon]|nr:thioredoxin [Candidatus Woesearchaeota archaeon]